ncbi:MAG: nucleotidyltransferase domain-containing protein [Frankia sp.]|nr:nucleotidyltransferase domain-containing protein [Frankia sp.]
MTLAPTAFGDLNALLTDFVREVQRILGGAFRGAYLHGSFALGAPDEHSDVDFIVATVGELSPGRPDTRAVLVPRQWREQARTVQPLQHRHRPVDVARARHRARGSTTSDPHRRRSAGRAAARVRRGGAEWALTAVDDEWRPLIRRALGDRAEPWRRVHEPADADAIDETLAFAAYALATARAAGGD